ncbi:MAG: hypothetical protein KA714_09270 [Limnoraphis sp. WC205]|jgi:hypothetical protein|nr:hypothetical protein [Limnoraphis sp. WC205]
MRILISLAGLALVLLGVYFLGQNIVFTSRILRYWWQDMSAASSVILLIFGIVSLVFFPRETGNLGWVFVVAGVALVFINSRVLLRPTSLWSFFVAFVSMTAGLKLIRTGRIDF